jgi:hypothetical protein
MLARTCRGKGCRIHQLSCYCDVPLSLLLCVLQGRYERVVLPEVHVPQGRGDSEERIDQRERVIPVYGEMPGVSSCGGWPTFRDFSLHHSTEGAPSLRFLQGWEAMLPTADSGRIKLEEKDWSGREDLNLRPPGPEPDSGTC